MKNPSFAVTADDTEPADRAGIVAVILLAGGLSTRMGGGDKPLKSLGGRPVLRKETAAPQGTTEVGWNDVKQAGIVPGVYILRVTGISQSIIRKIVVM